MPQLVLSALLGSLQYDGKLESLPEESISDLSQSRSYSSLGRRRSCNFLLHQLLLRLLLQRWSPPPVRACCSQTTIASICVSATTPVVESGVLSADGGYTAAPSSSSAQLSTPPTMVSRRLRSEVAAWPESPTAVRRCARHVILRSFSWTTTCLCAMVSLWYVGGCWNCLLAWCRIGVCAAYSAVGGAVGGAGGSYYRRVRRGGRQRGGRGATSLGMRLMLDGVHRNEQIHPTATTATGAA